MTDMIDTSYKTRVLDWSTIVESIDKLCKEIVLSDIKIDSIVGLSRGGLVPAVMIANQLGVREVYSYGVRSYDGKSGGDVKTYQWLGEKHLPGDTILVVDDISDRGATLGFVKKQLCKPEALPYEHKNINTCTICVKPRSNFLPTWTGINVEDDEWVIFPWEADQYKN